VAFVISFVLVSGYPNLVMVVSKYLPYFFGQNPLGENLWTASGVMPNFIETIHLIGIWPLSADFRFALPNGTYRVLGEIILLVAGLLLGKAPKSLQGLGIVGLGLYAALSFSGTYLNFKVVGLSAPLVSFVVFFSLIDLIPASWRVGTWFGGGCLLGTLLLSYSFSIQSVHSQNVVTSGYINDLLTLKKQYLDKHDVLLLDTMEFASYIMEDAKDFSPMTQYLHRPWPGSSVDLVVLNRNTRQMAEEYLAKHKLDDGMSIIVDRSCLISEFKQWEIYRVCRKQVERS
jgi:hypothetical protein